MFKYVCSKRVLIKTKVGKRRKKINLPLIYLTSEGEIALETSVTKSCSADFLHMALEGEQAQEEPANNKKRSSLEVNSSPTHLNPHKCSKSYKR